MSNSSLTCFVCSKAFQYRSALLVHIRKFHNMDTGHLLKRGVSCNHPDCGDLSSRFSNTTQYRQHLHDVHSVPEILKSCQYAFRTLSEFMLWKSQQEKADVAQFVALRGQALRGGCVVYTCNRSGSYASQSTGKRQVKGQGSKKCGCSCPATLVLKQSGSSYLATYHPTHYGHEKDVRHLSLTHEDKLNIADDVLSGVPTHQIVERLRSSNVPERINLVTRKDVANVKAAYKSFTKLAGKSTDKSADQSGDQSSSQSTGLPLDEPVNQAVSVPLEQNTALGGAGVPYAVVKLHRDLPSRRQCKKNLMSSHIEKLLGDIGNLVTGIRDEESIGPTVIAMLTSLKRLLLVKRKRIPAKSAPLSSLPPLLVLPTPTQQPSNKVAIPRMRPISTLTTQEIRPEPKVFVIMTGQQCSAGTGRGITIKGQSVPAGLGLPGTSNMSFVGSTRSAVDSYSSALLPTAGTSAYWTLAGQNSALGHVTTGLPSSFLGHVTTGLPSSLAPSVTASCVGKLSSTVQPNPWVSPIPLSVSSVRSSSSTGRPLLPLPTQTTFLVTVPSTTQGVLPISVDSTTFSLSSSSSSAVASSAVTSSLSSVEASSYHIPPSAFVASQRVPINITPDLSITASSSFTGSTPLGTGLFTSLSNVTDPTGLMYSGYAHHPQT